MSLTVFLAFCILGLDFMIYSFFRWIYGDKRAKVQRQLPARRRKLAKWADGPACESRTRTVSHRYDDSAITTN
jgi:hypothetical protein